MVGIYSLLLCLFVRLRISQRRKNDSGAKLRTFVRLLSGMSLSHFMVNCWQSEFGAVWWDRPCVLVANALVYLLGTVGRKLNQRCQNEVSRFVGCDNADTHYPYVYTGRMYGPYTVCIFACTSVEKCTRAYGPCEWPYNPRTLRDSIFVEITSLLTQKVTSRKMYWTNFDGESKTQTKGLTCKRVSTRHSKMLSDFHFRVFFFIWFM